MFGGRSDLKFNELFLRDYPNSINMRLAQIQKKYPNVKKLSTNEEYELKSSTFEALDAVFLKEEPQDREKYWKLIGLSEGKRTYRWIERKYMQARYPQSNNLSGYKVFVPESNGSGAVGEATSTPVIGAPLIGTPLMSATPTFISIGNFQTLQEAENLLKYIKTKFARVLLGVLKITQHNPPPKWAYIPLQDFTDQSDIDWQQPIPNIDQQLYQKYGLDENEIAFIEQKVRAME